MADIQIGDVIFGEDGKPCRVLRIFDAHPESAYRLTFSDGSTIDACADHQWITWTHRERKAYLRSSYEQGHGFPDNWPIWKGKRKCGGSDLSEQVIESALALYRQGYSLRSIGRRLGVARQALAKHCKAGKYLRRTPIIYDDAIGPCIRTTQEIVETLTYGKRQSANHCIPCTRPLELPLASVPIDPYILGVWLGDGTSADGSLTAHELDHSHFRQAIERAGYQHTIVSDPQRIGTRGLYADLRRAGVLGNKHLPSIYLRGSIDQRIAVLRGLMDTDGNIENGNTVAFVNTNKQLIESVTELVHSLGMKTTVYSGIGCCNGKEGKPFWRVQFTSTINPFLLPRKAKRITLGGAQSIRNYHRMIIKAERISSTPMRCLTVDSPNSLFLVGRAMIPTHNTRTGAETVREWVDQGFRRIALLAATPADARDVMITGESGLLHIYPEHEQPLYQPSLRRLTWPNGAIATIYSAHKHEDKSGLRGPQHEKAWGDEPAKWQYPGNLEQLMLGLRIGGNPQAVLTGTPRPIKLIRDLVKESKRPESPTVVTFGTTYENRANLAPSWFSRIIRKYEGTRLGRQELEAALLEDIQGALWTREMIQRSYSEEHAQNDEGEINLPLRDSMERIVVAVDPSVSDGKVQDVTEEQTAETGIIVCGRRGNKGHLLDDRSIYAHPSIWAQHAVDAYRDWDADYIVAEKNNGGELVRLTIQSVPGARTIPVKLVTASRGKYTRAEPVALLHERNGIEHHGVFSLLEDQLTTWIPGMKSPDRLDAYVWGMTELLVDLLTFGVSMVGEQDEERLAEQIIQEATGQCIDRSIIEEIKRGGLYFPS